MTSKTHGLKLNRETVRDLETAQLGEAKGGAMVTNDLCPGTFWAEVYRIETVIWTA